MSLILDGTNGLSDVDGTAATPAIRGTDTNTGIFFPAADTIAFAEGGTEVARFDSAGNLGIGTASPAVRLDLGSGANVSGFKMTDQWQDIVTSSHVVGTRYNYGSGTYYGRLYSNATGFNLDTGTSAVNMVFGTNSTERMRITSSGNLLVNRATGIYSDAKFEVKGAASATAACLQIGTDGFAAWSWRNVAGSEVGYISINASSTAYATSSDYRLKENIAPMIGALETVAQLKPVTYNWKADGSSGQGFIAHELQAVVPDCVTGEKDGTRIVDELDEDGKKIGEKVEPIYQGIDTSFLVATLTAAIQELKATVDVQAERIAALENPPVESVTNERH